MEQPDQQPPAPPAPPPPPGARQKRGPSRATSAPSQPQAPHPETTVLWTDAGAARASPMPTTITSQPLPPTLQEKVQRSDELASNKVRPVSHIAAAAASLPREVADSCAVLKRLCSRLSSIERPEATLLYAALMTTRAKLVHAGSWVGEGV